MRIPGICRPREDVTQQTGFAACTVKTWGLSRSLSGFLNRVDQALNSEPLRKPGITFYRSQNRRSTMRMASLARINSRFNLLAPVCPD